MQHITIGDFMFRQRYVTLLTFRTLIKFHCYCLRLLTQAHAGQPIALLLILPCVNHYLYQTYQDKKLAGLMRTHFMHAVLLFYTG